MFDLGFSEIMLIMVVALVVVGPERLPGLARKVGYWVGRFRRYVINVRSEIERELNADELRSMLSKQEDEIRELRDMLQDTRSQIRGEVEDISREVESAGEPLRHARLPDRQAAVSAPRAVEQAPEAAQHAPAAAETTHSSPASGSSGAGVKRDEESAKP